MNPPATIPYFDGKRSLVVYPLIWAECVKRATDDIEWAKKVSLDKEWQSNASDWSLETMKTYLTQTVEQRARHHYSYWHLRANSVAGYIAVDPQARREWVELGGELES